jgi:hypothetical protein
MSMSSAWMRAIGRQGGEAEGLTTADPGAVTGLENQGGDVVYEATPRTEQWVVDRPDPGRDLALATQAVAYLRGLGLDNGAVVQCLRDEFEFDLATAERMAGPPGTGHHVAAAG